MNLFARLFRLVWGGDVDRALRPVLAVSLAGSIAGSSAYPFMGIWAIKGSTLRRRSSRSPTWSGRRCRC
jgi:hypothetical protein